MGLTPQQFGKLTPREFDAICKGHRKADRAEWYRQAWTVSNLMAVHLGNKAPSPEKLLGWVKHSRRSPSQGPKRA